MAFLNQQERDKLAKDLSGMKFNKAKHKLSRMDPKGRLAFYRNNQSTDRYFTRFNLEGLGTRVTLVERHSLLGSDSRAKAQWVLTDVIVEPTPDNRT